MPELHDQRLYILGNFRLKFSKSTRVIRNTIATIVKNHEEFSDS